jgi:iron complex transport system substrate-binding protein
MHQTRASRLRRRIFAMLLFLGAALVVASVACGDGDDRPGVEVIEEEETGTGAGTGAGTATGATTRVTDDLGREVEIPHPPQRVAATVSFAVEFLMALDYRPVARPDIPEELVFPLEAKDIAVIEVSHQAGPNLEQLAAAQPDLVISSPVFAQFAPSIEQTLGVPVLVYDVTSFDDVIDKVRTFGMLLGREAKAEEVAGDLQAKLSDLQDGLPAEGPKVFALFGTSQAFLGFLPDSYLGSLVELLGAQLVTRGDQADQRFPGFAPFSLETVVARDPDVILIVRHGRPSPEREENIEALTNDAAWRGLPAVQAGAVYELPETLYVNFPGPRVIQALEELRAILFPER